MTAEHIQNSDQSEDVLEMVAVKQSYLAVRWIHSPVLISLKLNSDHHPDHQIHYENNYENILQNIF